MDLARTQLLSLITKGVTATLTIIQSLIVARLLGPDSYGLVGLVLAVGGLVGVTQHVGIVGGAIREIAIQKTKREAVKVFWVAHLVRQAVTLPLSLLLLVGAGAIAEGIYHKPEITPYLQLFAGILILQGIQDVLGAALTGRKRFAWLYGVQVVTAAINVVVFALAAWLLGVAGFFAAMTLTTAIMIIWLGFLNWREFAGYMALPSWHDMQRVVKQVLETSGFMYLSRIFFMIWQRLPVLALGGIIAADELGYLSLSLRFGGQLTILSMALSEVNLAWMSSLFSERRSEFVKVATRNMHRLVILLIGITLTGLFFTPEVLQYLLPDFIPALPHILIVTSAFFVYALLDIGTSTVFVPARQARVRAGIYALMMSIPAIVIGGLFITRPDSLLAVWALLVGALVAYVLMVVLAKRRFAIVLLTYRLAWLLVMLGVSLIWLLSEPTLLWRIVVYVLLAAYVLWEVRQSRLLPNLQFNIKGSKLSGGGGEVRIICFAGAAYDLPFWTNRQHVMSQISKSQPVLYVEPRIWLFRFLIDNWQRPGTVLAFLTRCVWYQKVNDRLYIKAQWNLIPGSRSSSVVAQFNHYFLNRWNVLLTARLLGFRKVRPVSSRSGNEKVVPTPQSLASEVVWIYDTEAAEYLDAFPQATVVYDCVDDHAAQAGPDRNPERVEAEEQRILKRADLVTVTSQALLKAKRRQAKVIHLVTNAGDVELFATRSTSAWPFSWPQGNPVLGSVGALDSYKYDFKMIADVAQRRPGWQFVFVGAPVVEQKGKQLAELKKLGNVHILGTVPRQEVPGLVAHFDVCLIPYRENRYNAASFPLKFWEFMATGKPIVVSGLPELKSYQDVIGLITSADQFIRETEKWLRSPELSSSKRSLLARDHSWAKRTERLLWLLSQTINHE